MFEWRNPATVIIQPTERTSGLDVSMDGRRTGSRPTEQSRVGLGTSVGDMGQMASQIGNAMGGLGNGLGGLGGIFG